MCAMRVTVSGIRRGGFREFREFDEHPNVFVRSSIFCQVWSLRYQPVDRITAFYAGSSSFRMVKISRYRNGAKESGAMMYSSKATVVRARFSTTTAVIVL